MLPSLRLQSRPNQSAVEIESRVKGGFPGGGGERGGAPAGMMYLGLLSSPWGVF